jgi:hypothetical protein
LAHSAEVVVVVATLGLVEVVLHAPQVSVVVVVVATLGLVEVELHAPQVSAAGVEEEAFTGVGVATTQT